MTAGVWAVHRSVCKQTAQKQEQAGKEGALAVTLKHFIVSLQLIQSEEVMKL